MNFIETIFRRLHEVNDRSILIEIKGTSLIPISGATLLDKIGRVRQHLSDQGIAPGDRVILLGPNSADWVACNLAILAQGAVCVPFYHRQKPEELLVLAKDCTPKLALLTDSIFLLADIPCSTFAEAMVSEPLNMAPNSRKADSLAFIVYTSGTSGRAKGVMISCANVDCVIPHAAARTEHSMGRATTDHLVFHFLPLCFLGSSIMLLVQLWRGNAVMLSTDLSNLVEEMKTAAPNYFQTVPQVLERIRAGVEMKLAEKGAFLSKMIKIFFSGQIRSKIGRNLKFIICGSAPLNPTTQKWFEKIGIPILQVYGLTETTAVVTMDRMGQIEPGYVGKPIDECQIKVTSTGEFAVKGPNVFIGYWNQRETTAQAMQDGWFLTGDQIEIGTDQNLRVLGRANSVLVPESGHNIAPEPIEQSLLEKCRQAEHAVVVGHGKPYLAVLITGSAQDEEILSSIDQLNEGMPHYKKIRKYHRLNERFTVENGLLTANQKLKRKIIERRFENEIEELYK